MKGLQIEFNGGQRSLLDVLDGERELLLSQVDHVRARYDARIADFFLPDNVGRLAPQHFSITEKRPVPVARLLPEFNTWDLRLGPSENDAVQLEVADGYAAPPTTGQSTATPRINWGNWPYRTGG